MNKPDDDKSDLTPEALAAHRAETQKILDEFLAKKPGPDTRSDAEIIAGQNEILKALHAMGEYAAAQGITDEELEKIIEEEVAAVRAERDRSAGYDREQQGKADEK